VPAFGPTSRRDLIRYLRLLGFDGPVPGARHEFMVRGSRRVHIPNPHEGDIARGLLDRILEQAGVTREEWESL
jgi:hypothetical protein